MKKFWIWSGSILGFIAILVILSFTLFTLKSVKMEFHNATTLFASAETQNTIISDAKFAYKSCVFSVDKQKYINKLEKDYPFLKIINIETQFPSTFVLHAKEREPVFALNFLGGYYVVDKDFKVLEVKTETFVSTQTNLIEITAKNLVPISLTAGDFVSLDEVKVMKNISPSFELTNRNIYSQMALIKSIEIITTTNVQKPTDTKNFGLLMTDFNGLEIRITNAKTHLAEKINMFCAVQSRFVDKVSTHYCLVYEKSNGVIEAQAVEKPI